MPSLFFSSRKSKFSVDMIPPLILDPTKKWKIALIEFIAYNTIPNVDVNNNCIHFYKPKKLPDGSVSEDETYEIRIEPGAYEIEDISKYIEEQTMLGNNVPLMNIHFNKNTGKTYVTCLDDWVIDFTKENSIGPLLGFSKRKIYSQKIVDLYKVENDIAKKNAEEPDPAQAFVISKTKGRKTKNTENTTLPKPFEEKHGLPLQPGKNRAYSDKFINISKVTQIRILTSNLIDCNYKNGIGGQSTIYESSLNARSGEKIHERPSRPRYFPLKTTDIYNVDMKIEDQDGDEINFQDEEMIVILDIMSE